VLIFVFKGKNVLLQRGAPTKKLWANRYNGVGGHIERGEDLLTAAYRELNEETGLVNVDLMLCGTIIIDIGQNNGVLLFVMKGNYQYGDIKPSAEGEVEWVNFNKIKELPVMEDLPTLLEHVKKSIKGRNIFHGRSWHDEKGILRIVINYSDDFLKKQ
jgi:8-oxo-dGTP diphosphatase